MIVPRDPRRLVVSLAAVMLVTLGACGERTTGVPGQAGQEVAGCPEAVRERAFATAAIDSAEKQALARDRARAQELGTIASQGKHAVVLAADLSSCDDRAGGRGVAVDLADLRARYRVVVDRTTAQLSEAAARPVPTPAPRRDDDTKGDDRRGRDRGRG